MYSAGHCALFAKFKHETMDFDKFFYKDLFKPLRKLVFPAGTTQKRDRKDVDVQSIRTLGFNRLRAKESETGRTVFNKEHRKALGGHEPDDTEGLHYDEGFKPNELLEPVEALAELLPAMAARPLNLRPSEYQKFGKPQGRLKKIKRHLKGNAG